MKLVQFTGDGADTDINSDVLHMCGADGNDFTLCGITLDGDDKTAGSFNVINAPRVTCPSCVAIIKHCRRAKI